MKNFFNVLIFIVSCASPLFGIVQHAPSIDIVERCVDSLDDQALVVFDVDATLIQPRDRIRWKCCQDYRRKAFEKFPVSKEELDRVMSLIDLRAKFFLLEPMTHHLIEKLEKKNIRTIALTAMNPGKSGLIPDKEEWRFESLHNLGIDFERSFPGLNRINFEEFEGKEGVVPSFRHGIISSSAHPKGEVLCSFLKQINWKPSVIIFVDDKIEQVDSVEKELNNLNIPHIAFHYTFVEDHPIQLDEKVASFQVDHLFKYNEWLGEEEAKTMMDNN
jgi:hypothetical protein